ncbi:hypothetical protein Tco_1568765 [Tanacetum coccineum]
MYQDVKIARLVALMKADIRPPIDDEASNHEDASDTGAAPKQQQQVIPQTTAISNIKPQFRRREEYDILAMEDGALP